MKTNELDYIHQAIHSGEKLVEVLRRKVDPRRPEPIYMKVSLDAKAVLRNLQKPYQDRKGGWKDIFPKTANITQGPASIAEKLDQNALSDPQLIERLESLGFVKAESQSTTPPASQMTPEDMLKALQESGLVSKKVKLKGEEPNQLSTETE